MQYEPISASPSLTDHKTAPACLAVGLTVVFPYYTQYGVPAPWGDFSCFGAPLVALEVLESLRTVESYCSGVHRPSRDNVFWHLKRYCRKTERAAPTVGLQYFVIFAGIAPNCRVPLHTPSRDNVFCHLKRYWRKIKRAPPSVGSQYFVSEITVGERF